MKRTWLLLITASLVVACKSSDTTSQSSAISPPLDQRLLSIASANNRALTSDAERALVEEILQHWPAEDRNEQRQLLMSSAVKIEVSEKENPMLFRQLRTLDSLRAAAVPASRSDDARDVTFVVARSATVANSRAIVLRNGDERSTPMVVLGADFATPENLGAALRALARAEKNPKLKGKQFRLRLGNTAAGSSKLPRKWNAGVAAAVADQIAEVKGQAEEDIPGVGRGRKTTLRVAKTASP